MEYFAWRRAGLFNLAHDTYHSLGKPDAAFEEAGAGDVGLAGACEAGAGDIGLAGAGLVFTDDLARAKNYFLENINLLYEM